MGWAILFDGEGFARFCGSLLGWASAARKAGNVSPSSAKIRKDSRRRGFVAAAPGSTRGRQESFVTLACPFLQLCETSPFCLRPPALRNMLA
jgi:hypothetical protein